MKIDLILIPTLGRLDRQLTYNNFSQRMKDMTKFVVQTHEYDEMEKRYPGKVICLPENVKNLPLTRQWTWENFADRRYLVFDDDLTFFKQYVVGEDKYKANKLSAEDEQEFDGMLAMFENLMNNGYTFGGLRSKAFNASVDQFPYYDNSRLQTAFFFDGPKLPKDIDWTRVLLAEDFDACLQLLSRGYKNACVIEYAFNAPAYAKGGCNLYRTVELHNNSMRHLRDLWPDYVTLREKTVNTKEWGEQTMVKAIIQTKKAYKVWKANNLVT